MTLAVVVAATIASIACGPGHGRHAPSGARHATIPLTIVQGPNGTFLVARVAVGGGKPVPVLVDTGSISLMVMRQAVGRHAKISPGGRPPRRCR